MSVINIQPDPRKIVQYMVDEKRFGSLPICIWDIEDVLSLTYKEVGSIVFRTLRNRVRKSTGGIPISIKYINK